MGEIPGRASGFALGWAVVLVLGVSALGFAAPANGQASETVRQGEDRLSVNVTGSIVIDLCKWEPMSCPRCMIEPWYCIEPEPEPCDQEYGSYIVVFWDWVEDPLMLARAQVEKYGGKLGFVYKYALKGYSAEYPRTVIEAVKSEPSVHYISVDRPVEVFGFSSKGQPPDLSSIYMCEDEEPAPKKGFVLKIARIGSGSGAVADGVGGISCGSRCEAEYGEGTQLVLTASPSVGSTFSSWRGCDVAIGRECRITVDGAEAVSAKFTEVKTLSVQKEGEGAGSVTTSPGGIACPMACSSTSALFPTGRSVAVSASPAKGSVFTGWGGACSGTGACAVTLSESKSVTAEFTPLSKRALTLNKEGNGAGTVKSLPSTFNCGTFCASQTSSFNEGTVVTLMQTPAKGSVFSGWTGACSGTGACVVTLSEAETVGAAFALLEGKPTGPTRLLAVGKAEGTGTGTVSSRPGGIACYSGCTHQSARFKEGAVVALEATPGRNSTFTEWGGACTGSGACEVTMSEARSVTAEFTAIPNKTLTVNKAGEGSGVVVGKPSFGISCRLTCTTATAFFPQTTTVALIPVLGSMSGSYHWTGCDGIEGAQCIVTTPGDKTITATFE